MAGLTAAWVLSEPRTPESGDPPVEVTVYQRGWTLGGKGASVRGPHGRIEEHGLHVWLGYYDNAFALMREVYSELDRPRTAPDCPITTFRDAFAPAGQVGIGDPATGADAGTGGWSHWLADFSSNTELPGESDAPGPSGVSGTLTVTDFVSRGLRLLADFATSLAPEDPVGPVLSASPEPVRPARSATARFGSAVRLLATVGALEASRLLVDLGATSLAEPVDRIGHELRDTLEELAGRDPAVRRSAELADLVLACLRGVLVDGLLTDPRGFGAADDVDFTDWLARHGAARSTRESPLVRGMYDLVFAYVDGDRDRPSFSAGLGLLLASRLFFDYRGSIFWHMTAGMGDVVFAPLHQALRARGVRFAFFHRLDDVHLTADRKAVGALTFTREARLRDPDGAYEPLVDVDGLPCFPAEPDPGQLDPGLVEPERLRLEIGRDVDDVVLAVSLGMVPRVAGELVAHAPAWREMTERVATVPTQSLQLWLRRTEAELGWPSPGATVSGYAEPFDTYASMTHLLPREQWPDGEVGSLAYFCGVLRRADAGGTEEEAQTAVRRHAVTFLEEQVGDFWPRSTAASGTGFDWDLLAGTGTGSDRLDSQYVRANVDPSDTYVQSLPGTAAHRLRVDGSGYDRLFLAGDWTDCGLNAGCIEAAAMSGRQAANAVLGRSLTDGLRGQWYGLPT